MNAIFNIWTILFLLAALHGIGLALFFLFRKEGRGSSNKLLGIFLLLFSLTLIDYVGYWTGYQRIYPHLLNLSSTFVFLFGPMLYLYIISVFRPEKVFRIQNIIHFLPFLVFLGFMVPFYFQSGAAKLDFMEPVHKASGGFGPHSAGIISIKIFHLLSYSLVILFYTKFRLFRNKIRANDFSSEDGRWLGILSYNFIGFSICFTLYHLSVIIYDFSVEYDYLISLAMAIFIFSIGYLGYANKHFIKPLQGTRKND